ncbi:hypothetical protein FH581_015570 [Leptospira weilii]|nr:hypothetical protein FH581_015570 [Leptospira weilii]
MQNDLEHLIERMYQFYNKGNDDRTLEVLQKIRILAPEFRPEPKIILVEQVLIHPSDHSLKPCEEAAKAIYEKRFVRGLNQAQKTLQTNPFFLEPIF